MANGAAGKQCDGYYPHLSLMRVQPQTLGLAGPSVSPLAFYPVSDRAAGGGEGRHHISEGQNALLHIKANTTRFQQEYPRLPRGDAVPEGGPGRICNNCRFRIKKKEKEKRILTE